MRCRLYRVCAYKSLRLTAIWWSLQMAAEDFRNVVANCTNRRELESGDGRLWKLTSLKGAAICLLILALVATSLNGVSGRQTLVSSTRALRSVLTSSALHDLGNEEDVSSTCARDRSCCRGVPRPHNRPIAGECNKRFIH